MRSKGLVVFADVGDRLAFVPAGSSGIVVQGPTAEGRGAERRQPCAKQRGRWPEKSPAYASVNSSSTRQLPVAAGLGGGSADAAAALRLLARASELSSGDSRLYAAAVATGADVPVCLDPCPRIMRGIGEMLSGPIALPELPAVLVNPGVAVPTRDVFSALAAPPLTPPAQADDFSAITADAASLVSLLTARRNDLEIPAIKVQPVIANVLAALQAFPNCLLARMSGSGATCFGLFGSVGAAEEAARRLQATQRGWWVRATMLR
jgi:4-diphosphocytidyl-2-C-methyl-D-erythritol kinase